MRMFADPRCTYRNGRKLFIVAPLRCAPASTPSKPIPGLPGAPASTPANQHRVCRGPRPTACGRDRLSAYPGLILRLADARLGTRLGYYYAAPAGAPLQRGMVFRSFRFHFRDGCEKSFTATGAESATERQNLPQRRRREGNRRDRP
jgi:hypothetical protein